MLLDGLKCNDARVINKTPRCARTSVGFLFHDPLRYSHKREASASRYNEPHGKTSGCEADICFSGLISERISCEAGCGVR